MEMSTGSTSNEVNTTPKEITEAGSSVESFGFGKKEAAESMSLEKAQEVAEDVHRRAADQITELHGKYLTEEGKERLAAGADNLEAVPYRQGAENIGSFSYHEGNTKIKVCAIDEAQVERTTQHETNHMASYNFENVSRDLDNPSLTHVKKMSGIHSLEYKENESGRVLEFEDRYRGFNEGITQMYTNRQLELIEPGKGAEAARQNGYMFATELSEQVEQIVGPEFVAQAYYGGNLESLQQEIDRLGGPGAFERLSKDMDRVTYTEDYLERFYAMQDAQEVLAGMSEGGAA